MSSNSWVQLLSRQYTDGTALTNTTTPTSIIPVAERFVLPAGLLFPGARLKVRAGGRMSTAGATPGTLTLDIRFGSVVVFNGGASPTLATSASNLSWLAEIELQCRAYGAGTSANMLGMGTLLSAALSASTPVMLLPASAPAVGTGFDSTASQAVDLYATWSFASASNTITLHDFALQLLN
jgi:hypothetical protein